MADPMSDERLAEIRQRADVLTRAIDAEFAKDHDAPYAHGIEYYLGAAVQVTRAVPALLAEVERLRAELARWEGHDALTKTLVQQAEAERDRLAEQVRVLAELFRRAPAKVLCPKHPDVEMPGSCEVCRDAAIFRAALDGGTEPAP